MVAIATIWLMPAMMLFFVIRLCLDSIWREWFLNEMLPDEGMFCRTLGTMAAMHLISGSEVMSEIVRMGIFRQMK